VRKRAAHSAWFESCGWAGIGREFVQTGLEARPGERAFAGPWQTHCSDLADRLISRASPADRPNGCCSLFCVVRPRRCWCSMAGSLDSQMAGSFLGLLFEPAPQRGLDCPCRYRQ